MAALLSLAVSWLPQGRRTPPPPELPPPTIDSERVTVRELTSAPTRLVATALDQVRVYLAPTSVTVARGERQGRTRIAAIGDAYFVARGARVLEEATTGAALRTIVIELKDHPVAPLANTSGYPNAFPRPGSKKVVEDERVLVWDYTWTPGQPTPMHFHDKDAVVVFLRQGALESTTPDGQSVVNELTVGMTRFNLRDRVHTERLVNGESRAIITELK